MFYEYAVEPQAIGSSWETFRYIIEKFGFDKGRLISQFPENWFREVYGASGGLLPMQRKRIEEALRQAKVNKVVRYGRSYDDRAGDWLFNALTEHRRSPFHAIIANKNPSDNKAVLIANDLDEQQSLMVVPHSRAVLRDAASLSAAMKEILCFGSQILFVDLFFDPFNRRYQSTFRACLDIVKSKNSRATCEVHYRYHENKPSNSDLERESKGLFRRVIPEGLQVTIFCWREKPGGQDFHARYLLSERGGIAVDAGFSAEGNQQTTDMHLMSSDLSHEKLKLFAREAACYELVEPVIRVASDGQVKRL
jgi:hypothetical protein